MGNQAARRREDELGTTPATRPAGRTPGAGNAAHGRYAGVTPRANDSEPASELVVTPTALRARPGAIGLPRLPSIRVQPPASYGMTRCSLLLDPGAEPIVHDHEDAWSVGGTAVTFDLVPTGQDGRATATVLCSDPAGEVLASQEITIEIEPPLGSQAVPPGRGPARERPAEAPEKLAPQPPAPTNSGTIAPPTLPPLVDCGQRMVASGPGPFMPFYVIPSPGQQHQLQIQIEPILDGWSGPFEQIGALSAFRLGKVPRWTRPHGAAEMGTVQFEPPGEGMAEAWLVVRAIDMNGKVTEARSKLRGEGVRDGLLRDDLNRESDGSSTEHDGQPRAGFSGNDAAANDAGDAVKDLYQVRSTQVALVKDEQLRSQPHVPLRNEHEANLLHDAVIFGLSLVTSGLFAHVAKRFAAHYTSDDTAANEILAKIGEGLLSSGFEAAASGAQLVQDEAGTPVIIRPIAKGSAGAVSADAAIAFFYTQIHLLEDAGRRSRRQVKDELLSLAAQGHDIRSAARELAAAMEAQVASVRQQQVQTTTARWLSFLAQRNLGSQTDADLGHEAQSTKIDDPALTKVDRETGVARNRGALLDIGVQGGHVVSAQVRDLSPAVVARIYHLDLLAQRVPFRVFDAGLGTFVVIRNESGQLAHEGDLTSFARLRGVPEGLSEEERNREGARALAEDVVGSRTLAAHGVAIEQVVE